MTLALDYLTEFDEDITASHSLPYCQIHNPPNLSLAQIEQYKAPWGLFIPCEQAELVQFNPSDSFEPTRLTFGEDTPNPRAVEGFLSQRLRMVIIHRSAGIEVQEKTSNGWRYVGQAYHNGQPSEIGERAFSDKENYRLRTRYLLLFLDDDNRPLHTLPLRLGMGRGTGGSFGEEVKVFRGEIERVFFKLRGEPQKSLSDRAHALTVLEFKLGLHKSEGKAPFVCPVWRYAPALDQVGVEKVVERRERKVLLEGKALQSLLIAKSSQTGQLILSLWEEYQDFPTRFSDDLIHKEQEEVGASHCLDSSEFEEEERE